MVQGLLIILSDWEVPNAHSCIALRTNCPGDTMLQTSLGGGATHRHDPTDGSLQHLLWMTTTHLIQDDTGWIEQCFTSTPTQYRLYARRFLQVKRPNQQYQSTEGTYSTQTNQTYNKQTYKHKTANHLVYNNMGWLGDGSHRGQGCQAWQWNCRRGTPKDDKSHTSDPIGSKT